MMAGGSAVDEALGTGGTRAFGAAQASAPLARESVVDEVSGVRGPLDNVPAEGVPFDEVLNVGHLAAALTPLFARDDNARARLTRAGALRALARWAPWIDGDVVARTGTLQLAKSVAKEADLQATMDALGFPPDWVRAVDAKEASGIAGTAIPRGGLYFPDGLRVRPQALCERLLAHPGIVRVKAQVHGLRQVDITREAGTASDIAAAGGAAAPAAAAARAAAARADATAATAATAAAAAATASATAAPAATTPTATATAAPTPNVPADATSAGAPSRPPSTSPYIWQALDAHGAVLAAAEVVIIANSTGAPQLLRRAEFDASPASSPGVQPPHQLPPASTTNSPSPARSPPCRRRTVNGARRPAASSPGKGMFCPPWKANV
ncbi:hypothetical protein [Pigmentiphaga litoralis]|uniref:hypothetical protein n=1 Tax=Pigmentiphaga litoralis TaxID=516702 RepID=UPI003B43AB2C